MNTKTLSSPFPDNEGSGANSGVAGNFDLDNRKAVVDWDASSLSGSVDDNRLTPTVIQTLGLYIVSQNIELVVDLLDVNYIGRSYPQNGYFDGIDFSAFDAYKLGVSRRHVILKRDGGKLFIVDNNSTNGTYLNRAMLHPLQPYLIKHDDHVRLGAFEFVIKLD